MPRAAGSASPAHSACPCQPPSSPAASAPPRCQLHPSPVQGWGTSWGLQTPGEHETASSSHVLQQPALCEVTSAWPGAGRQDTPCMQAVLLQTLPASRRRQAPRSSPATAYLQIEFHTCAPPEQARGCCRSRPAPLHPRPTPPPRVTAAGKALSGGTGRAELSSCALQGWRQADSPALAHGSLRSASTCSKSHWPPVFPKQSQSWHDREGDHREHAGWRGSRQQGSSAKSLSLVLLRHAEDLRPCKPAARKEACLNLIQNVLYIFPL